MSATQSLNKAFNHCRILELTEHFIRTANNSSTHPHPQNTGSAGLDTILWGEGALHPSKQEKSAALVIPVCQGCGWGEAHPSPLTT